MTAMALPIAIVPYDPRWPAAFRDEAERLAAALGPLALRIDHHGSTSVPGLAAKPILDIQISVASLAPMDRYREPLRALGYVHHAHADDSFAPFFHRPRDWPHTHHVHVVVAGGLEERCTLAFRDYLRAHEEARRAYEALKRNLASQFDADAQELYANAKGAFIEATVAKALAEGD